MLNSSSEAFSFLISATWAYCNLALYTLIATFLMRMGPVARARAAKNSKPIPEAIEAADNRATRAKVGQ